MDSFEILNKANAPKTYMNFDTLPIGEYRVTNFAIGKTKEGPRLKVTMGDIFAFLPERFMVSPEIVAQLNTEKMILVFKGKDAKQRHR